MSSAELSSIENGVWMCYKHGKLIDTDECTYTPDHLLNWRRMAERRAELHHALGRDVTSDDIAQEPLASITQELTTPDFVVKIADTFHSSMIEIVWGKQAALATRDLIIEIVRNALTHGNATYSRFEVKPHSVILTDDGRQFTLAQLQTAAKPRGGAMALSQVLTRTPEVVVSYRRDGACNVFEFAITKSLNDMLKTNPCSETVYGGRLAADKAVKFIEQHPECGTIFLHPQFGYMSYSDIFNLAEALRSHDIINRDVALIIRPHADGIREVISEEMPAVRLIEAP